MKPHLFRTSVVLATLLAACQGEPSSPSESTALPARGGIPGPPSGILLPPQAGLPPGLPVPPGKGPPTFLADWVSIGVGSGVTCALRSDGKAFCWGANSVGELGDGSTTGSSTPVPVAGGHTFVQLAVGDIASCGLEASGMAYCWGSNDRGQLGAGLPMSSSSFASTPVAVAGGIRFQSLSTGLRTTCGDGTDGVTYCWGANDLGQLGNGLRGVNSNVPVAVQNSAALGLRKVRAGFFASCAQDGAAALFCWGQRFAFGNGPISVSPFFALSPELAASGMLFTAVSVGTAQACGLDAAGVARCWGVANAAGNIGDGSTTLRDVPTMVTGGLTFRSIDANSGNNIAPHTCAVAVDDAAWCWGNNTFGQLGATSTSTCTFGAGFNCSLVPVRVTGGIRFASVTVGTVHTCGVALDGTAYCWGRNFSGQLGDGTTTDRTSPVAVRDP